MKNNKKLWVDLHAPKTIDEMVLPQRLKDRFKSGLNGNILLTGSPGTGKTTLAKILTKDMHTKIINSSLHTGIDDVREQIINYVSTASILSKGGLKALILDEVDFLSPSAQAALRGVIEKYSSLCRFVCTCNYPEKLTDAIISRFTVISFDEFSEAERKECCNTSLSFVKNILNKHKFNIEHDAVLHIFKKSYPDLRKIIGDLGQIAEGVKNSRNDNVITLDDIDNINNESNRELYDFLLKHRTPTEIMKYCNTHFNGSEQQAITSLGYPFMEYCNNHNKENIVSYIAVLSHKYEFEIKYVTDKLRSLAALCFELNNIVSKK